MLKVIAVTIASLGVIRAPCPYVRVTRRLGHPYTSSLVRLV